MIQTRQELKAVLAYEKPLYHPSEGRFKILSAVLRADYAAYRWAFIKALRKTEYYYAHRKENPYYMLRYLLCVRKKNRLGLKLGIEIPLGSCAKGLRVYHTFTVMVNEDARVGEDCILHGDNIIGNMGAGTGSPTLGKHVEMGVGAKVLGNVYIADHVKIGAGAVVLHSCYEEGAVLTGIPAAVRPRKGAGAAV